jgi:hypothetical protein
MRVDIRRHPPRDRKRALDGHQLSVHVFALACVASLLAFNLARAFGLS